VKYMGIGDLIKHIRTSHGLNQTELGDLMYRNRDFVYLVENGRATPNVKDLVELSKALSEPLLLYVAYGITLNDVLETRNRA
jgi:transcriptional regulator with XRE-family HTH domain